MTSALQQLLKQLVRKTSLSRLNALLNRSDIEIQDASENPDIATPWVGLILVTSDSIQVDFKIQCDNESVKFFAEQLNHQNDATQNHAANDLLYEYCNLVGGYIKNTLDQQQVAFKLSLPLITHNADNLIINVSTDANIFYDYWKLVIGNRSLFCSVAFEVKDDIVLTGEILEFADSGEIKFL